VKDFYRNSLSNTDDIFYSHLVRWSQFKQVSSYFNFSPSISEDLILEDLLYCLPIEFKSLSHDRKTQVIEFETLLSGYLLSSQGDRMSMAHSVEGRYPFLSQKFVKSMAGLHSFQKARGINSKSLFRKAMKGLLIDDICSRPKVAYQAPEAKSLLSSERISSAALLLRDTLSSLPALNAPNIRLLEKKILHPNSSSRLGFRENMAYIMSCSYAHLHKSSSEWS
jgi:asparagine synthase (glutamine-hydrolysing)